MVLFKNTTLTEGPNPYQWRSSIYTGWINGSWSTQSSIEGASFNHAPINTGIDDGGPFLLTRSTEVCTTFSVNQNRFIGKVTVGGPSNSTSGPNKPAMDTDAQMIARGTTAIARSAPTNPSFDAAVAVGELRQGVPSIIGGSMLRDQTIRARKAGKEYLNYEFGWRPLVNDLQTFARAVNDSHTTWAQYQKGSGHKTRVGYHFPDDSDSSWNYIGAMFPLPGTFGTPYGWLQGGQSQTTWSKRWFSGAFRYFVPEPSGGFSGKMDYWKSQAGKILGLRLTPEVVWNLSPWTWAMDWFANTGDLLHNISALGTDGLVLQYGYAMHETGRKTTSWGRWSGQGFAGDARREHLYKQARRVPSSPYGFGATLSSLSAKQVAVMTALGLTKT